MRKSSVMRKRVLAFAVAFGAAVPAFAGPDDYLIWSRDDGEGYGSGSGSFLDAANWENQDMNPDAPGITYPLVVIGGGGTATIAEDAGNVFFGSLQLGEFEDEVGHLVMNGGFLRIGNIDFDDDFDSHIGGNGVEESTFIMNGGTIFFDGPDLFPGDANNDGLHGKDLEIGEFGPGRFEMYGGVLRIADDLKVAEQIAGNGHALITGDSVVSIGSGIGVGRGSSATLIVSGNAVVDSGNSMGAGSAEGMTNEGYLTLNFVNSGESIVTIEENATVNIRTLQARDGKSTLTVRDNGQFHIFDVFAGSGTEFGVGLQQMNGNNNPSAYGSTATADAIIILQDNAVMTVDSVDGLSLGGNIRRGGSTGGKAELRIQDAATFSIVQDLRLGDGGVDTTTAHGILTVRGPGASIQIGTDLSFNPTDEAGAQGTFVAEITASTHSTVNVTGVADIELADLVVKLDGYTPSMGDSYALIDAGSLKSDTNDGKFATTDLSEAALDAGLFWIVKYDGGSVGLLVSGLGDFNGDGALDAFDVASFEAALADKDAFFAANPDINPDLFGDFNNDMVLDAFDVSGFEMALAGGGGSVPEPGVASLLLIAGLGALGRGKRRVTRR